MTRLLRLHFWPHRNLADLLGVIGLIGVAAPEVRALGSINAVAQEGGAAAERVLEITEAVSTVMPPANPFRREPIKGEIRFKGGAFASPDGSPALRGAELHRVAVGSRRVGGGERGREINRLQHSPASL